MTPPALDELVEADDTAAIAAWLNENGTLDIADELTRLDPAHVGITFRLLPRNRALEVFEALDPHHQQLVLDGLLDHRVRHLLEELDPDDRVRLLDEMPAKVAKRLLTQLSSDERSLTTVLMGYPEESAGRHMSPEFVSLRASMSVGDAMAKIRREGPDAETIYALPVLDDERHLIGVTGLRSLVLASPTVEVGELMNTDVHMVTTDTDREEAARLMREVGAIALPVVDSEARLVGVITVDDAMTILETEDTEDFALTAGHSPLRKPYLAVSAFGLARVRAAWLLVLILGAGLTVTVLERFEGTLEQVTVLALFVPLLIGTGGNSGAQASTAVIRAMAVGEVRWSDLPRIVWRETRVGVMLGAMLGGAAFVPVALLWEPDIATIVSLTLVTICTWATLAGSALPLFAKQAGVDPAVVSAPFITTLVDATGLIIYFLIARAVLGL
ncbi:MAG: magnesium transporter [Acidimicrobiales bacterium]|nr:magnesium transporter [Acidimicrobiales bacterium]